MIKLAAVASLIIHFQNQFIFINFAACFTYLTMFDVTFPFNPSTNGVIVQQLRNNKLGLDWEN